MNPVVILAGAATGLGLAMILAGLLPTRPDLGAALAALTTRPAGPLPDPLRRPTTGRPGRIGRLGPAVGGWAAGRAGGLPAWINPKDLALLGTTPELLWARKIGMGLLGLALPTPLLLLAHALGLHLPWTVPAAGVLLFAVLLSLTPDLILRQTAAETRAGFQAAVGSYLTLIALERAADGGPADALTRAAAVGHGPVFTRLADTLTLARVSGTPPWAALGALGEQTGVAELVDLADIVALAAGHGAAIYDTLLAKATSMRRTALAATSARAGARSEQMTLPAAVLFTGYLLLLIYPVAVRALHP